MTAAHGTDRSADSQTIAAAVLGAAGAAAGLLPSASPLAIGDPIADPDALPLSGGQVAVSARLTGEVSGDIVVLLSAEIADALSNSPVGPMDVATAVRPALDAAAAALGRVRISAERLEDAVAAVDGLRDKGIFLAVPLIADGAVQATLALQVTLPEAPRERRGSLDLLRNVAMEVTVEIGRTRMTVAELLSLYPGEVIELDRAASAPADLLVNGTLIARGEIVVVDEDFGLRITDIVTDAADIEAER